MARNAPDSRNPRRLTAASSTIAPTANHTPVVVHQVHRGSDVPDRRGDRYRDGQHIVDEQALPTTRPARGPRFTVATS